MRIVVVEELWKFRNEFEADLEALGCKLACVRQISGNEKVLSKFKPDILIWNKDLNLYYEEFENIRTIQNLENVHIIGLGDFFDHQLINKAFKAGADDYLIKPLDRCLFINKMSAAIRKIRPQYLDKCGLKLEAKSLSAVIDDTKIKLTKTHFNLLFELLRNYPETTHRHDLNKNVLKDVVVSERTIDVHVCALRKVLKPYKYEIESNRSLGYRLKLSSIRDVQFDLEKKTA